MTKIKLLRLLPFKVWHQPFESTGSRWEIGGYRNHCDCPYGKHKDPRFLDYKDPIHLNEILSMKEGAKLLTLYSWKGSEHVAFHTFQKIEFYSDFSKLFFKEELCVGEFDGTAEQFTPLRLLAVIEDADEITAFGKEGGIDVFIDELAKISGLSFEEIKNQVKELDIMPIPSELKINVEKINANAKKTGRLAPIFW